MSCCTGMLAKVNNATTSTFKSEIQAHWVADFSPVKTSSKKDGQVILILLTDLQESFTLVFGSLLVLVLVVLLLNVL